MRDRGACQPGSSALRKEADDQKVKKGLTPETAFTEAHREEHGEDAEEQDKEKSIRHGHTSTLHLCWTRHSLTAARAEATL